MHYRSRVEKILTEADPAGRGDRAVGETDADGSEHRADVVISAADGHATIFDMLEGRFISEKIRGYYEKRSPANHPHGVLAAVGRNPCLPTPYARGVGAG